MSKEKYSVVETENAYYIADNDEDVLLNVAVVVNRLNNYEQRLSNCIEPKFKPKSDLFVIVGYKDEPKSIEQYYIDEIVIRGDGKLIEYRDIDKETIIGEDNLLFLTKAEAEKKLEEMKNG